MQATAIVLHDPGLQRQHVADLVDRQLSQVLVIAADGTYETTLGREGDGPGELRFVVSGGASLEMIGKLLGHSQTQTTARYAHLMDSPLRAGVDAVASAFRPKPVLVHEAEEQARRSA